MSLQACVALVLAGGTTAIRPPELHTSKLMYVFQTSQTSLTININNYIIAPLPLLAINKKTFPNL